MEKKSKVTEEPATVTIAEHHTPPVVEKETIEPTPVTTPSTSTATSSTTSASSPTPDAPAKAKRIPSEKQRLNYLAANKRRVQILADAKTLRLAAASEKAREKAALDEYALAIKLSTKYGFNTSQAPPAPQPPAPPVQQASNYEPEGASTAGTGRVPSICTSVMSRAGNRRHLLLDGPNARLRPPAAPNIYDKRLGVYARCGGHADPVKPAGG
ncbi:hypothetical protein T492DRAFT_849683 [Pavlovales sp. CCMP2436]|nr:hypothetical protein T492DRAFT_849683 [Pavlovales sp. CCMP2436]